MSNPQTNFPKEVFPCCLFSPSFTLHRLAQPHHSTSTMICLWKLQPPDTHLRLTGLSVALDRNDWHSLLVALPPGSRMFRYIPPVSLLPPHTLSSWDFCLNLTFNIGTCLLIAKGNTVTWQGESWQAPAQPSDVSSHHPQWDREAHTPSGSADRDTTSLPGSSHQDVQPESNYEETR